MTAGKKTRMLKTMALCWYCGLTAAFVTLCPGSCGSALALSVAIRAGLIPEGGVYLFSYSGSVTAGVVSPAFLAVVLSVADRLGHGCPAWQWVRAESSFLLAAPARHSQGPAASWHRKLVQHTAACFLQDSASLLSC